MPYAKVENVRLYYQIYGAEYELLEDSARKKPTLVAVHGGPGTDHIFYDVPTLSDASEFAQVIFYDQRGNGRSIDINPEHWNLRQWALDLHSFCETLGLEKPFIHGISLGGWIAQLYASMYPEEPGGIILTDTEAYVNISKILDAYEHKGGPEVREIARRFLYALDTDACEEYSKKCIPLCSCNPMPDSWAKRAIVTPEVNRHFRKNELLKFNYLEDIKKIIAPVLFLSNTTNPYHLLSVARETYNAIKHDKVEFIEFENCGLVGVDAKELALTEIKRFINRYFS